MLRRGRKNEKGGRKDGTNRKQKARKKISALASIRLVFQSLQERNIVSLASVKDNIQGESLSSLKPKMQ